MNKGNRKKKGKVGHTVRELIPFSEFLENGAVQMSDGRIFDMFEIISTDTDNLPEEAIEMYIIRYAKLYNTYSANLKIVGMNFPTDTTEQQEYIQRRRRENKNPVFDYYLEEILERDKLINTLMSDKECYLFVYAKSQEEYDSILNMLNSTLGFGALLAQINVEKKIQILYKLNNMNSSIFSPDVTSPLLPQIQPQGGLDPNDERYLKSGDGYVSCLRVYHYPDHVDNRWLQAISMIDDVIFTIDIATEKPERARRNISKGMEEQQSRMDHARKESEYRDAEFLKSQYEAMYYEIQKMEDIIKLIHTRVYVAAQTIQELDGKVSRVIRSLEGAGFRAAIMINEVMYDYRSMFLPFDDQDKMPNRRKGQAITGVTLGMGLPNHHIMLKDPHGLYWGYTSTSGVVMLDTSHRTKRRLSSSGVIVGDKGSGKSSTLKKSIEHWAVIGDKVRGIATSDEYNSLITELGGKIIYLDRADSMVNPLQIQNVMPREKENFAAHITQMEAFYRCLVPDVNIYELKEFSRLLRRLYAAFGMYDVRSEDEPTKAYGSSAYPVFSDLLSLVRGELYQDLERQILRSNLSDNRKTHLEHIESILDNLVHTYPFLDAHSTVQDVTEEQIVFYNLGHIRSMAPELFDAQIATVNGLFHNNMYRSQQKYRDGIDNGVMGYDDVRHYHMIYDEAHEYLNARKLALLEPMNEVERHTRHYFADMWWATQNISDMVPENSSEEGVAHIKSLFQLTQYKIMMRQSAASLPVLQTVFSGQLTAQELNLIPKLEQGECILSITGDRNVHMQIELSERERRLFTGGV